MLNNQSIDSLNKAQDSVKVEQDSGMSATLFKRDVATNNSRLILSQDSAKSQARVILNSDKIESNIKEHFSGTTTASRQTGQVMRYFNNLFGNFNKTNFGETAFKGTKPLLDYAKKSELLDVGSKWETYKSEKKMGNEMYKLEKEQIENKLTEKQEEIKKNAPKVAIDIESDFEIKGEVIKLDYEDRDIDIDNEKEDKLEKIDKKYDPTISKLKDFSVTSTVSNFVKNGTDAIITDIKQTPSTIGKIAKGLGAVVLGATALIASPLVAVGMAFTSAIKNLTLCALHISKGSEQLNTRLNAGLKILDNKWDRFTSNIGNKFDRFTSHISNNLASTKASISAGLAKASAYLSYLGNDALNFGKVALAAVGNVSAKIGAGLVIGVVSGLGILADATIRAIGTTLNLSVQALTVVTGGLYIGARSLIQDMGSAIIKGEGTKHIKETMEILNHKIRESQTKTQMSVVDKKLEMLNRSLENLDMDKISIKDPKPPEKPTTFSINWWKTLFTKNSTISLGGTSVISGGQVASNVGKGLFDGTMHTTLSGSATGLGWISGGLAAPAGLYVANYALQDTEKAISTEDRVKHFRTENKEYLKLKKEAEKELFVLGEDKKTQKPVSTEDAKRITDAKARLAQMDAMLDQVAKRTGLGNIMIGAFQGGMTTTSGIATITTLAAGAGSAAGLAMTPVGWAATGALAVSGVGCAFYKVNKIHDRNVDSSKLEHQHNQIKDTIENLNTKIYECTVKGGTETELRALKETLAAARTIENDIVELRMRKDPKFSSEMLTEGFLRDDRLAKAFLTDVLGYKPSDFSLNTEEVYRDKLMVKSFDTKEPVDAQVDFINKMPFFYCTSLHMNEGEDIKSAQFKSFHHYSGEKYKSETQSILNKSQSNLEKV
jgi:hypothetical protein